jgi:hypothetical protein
VSKGDFPLSAALEYRNPDVVDSFLKTFAMPRAEAELLFEDVRRWLWLAGRMEDRHSSLFVDAGMLLFDEMWHAFVLFTREYAEFCEQYVGRFCHHTPATRPMQLEIARRAREEPEELARHLREQYTTMISLVVNELGEDVATRWFQTYRHQHTDAYIRSIHKYGRQPH